jgi:hypothetical protein
MFSIKACHGKAEVGLASACQEVWVCLWQGDIILVGLRDYQDEKADVILKCAQTSHFLCRVFREF